MGEEASEVRQRVLDQIQGAFPLAERPYEVLGARLGLSGKDVLKAVSELRADGTIRRLGASFSSKHLGHRSTLCAIAAPGDASEVDRLASIVSAHPCVTHNYLREDRFNVWFTLIAKDDEAIASAFAQIVADCGISPENALNLPATALYKIRVDFGTTRAGEVPAIAFGMPGQMHPFNRGDMLDVSLVRWAQHDARGSRPFADAAAYVAGETGDASVDEGWVLRRLNAWLADGTLRRFGAMVRHRKMGYGFNGMTVWNAEVARIDEVGELLASFAHVSHCYARPSSQAWPYNLYAMTHAKTREAFEAQVLELEQATGLSAKVLLSTKEYKKASPIYFAD